MSDYDVKLIAFYLPQYHPIPENDAWWGKDFTEWTNVRKAELLFPGHYQPHVPSMLGYYDLRDHNSRVKQAELAKEYGIYGFCYYHYWFNGKRLLEFPFNEVLKSKEPDFPFCLCWANENWTRRWDGSDNEILMGQEYTDEDSLNFIQALIPAFRDHRYITVQEKPLLVVYRTSLLPNPKRTTEIWRTAMKQAGIGEIFLARVENSYDMDEPNPCDLGFDAAIEFAPHWGLMGQRKKIPTSDSETRSAGVNLNIFDYEECMLNMMNRDHPAYPLYRGVFPSWDNTPRRRSGGTVFINNSPEKYSYWLSQTIKYTIDTFPKEQRFIFINAWNEWGEGCHLEPDQKYNVAFLEGTKAALDQTKDISELIARKDIITLPVTAASWAQEVCNSLQTQDKSLRERDSLLGKLHNDIHSKNNIIKSYEDAVVKYEAKLSNAYSEIAALNNELNALHASWSWRITRPLRRLLSTSFTDSQLISLYKVPHVIKRLTSRMLKCCKTPILTSPTITIGIASYNHSEYLIQCIDSVLNQTYKNIEVVIVDDNSSDMQNRNLLKEYENIPNVKIIYKDANEGISRSLNDQIIAASGDWVAFVDCDDYLPENAISEMVEYIKNNPEKSLLYSNRIEIDQEGNFIDKVWFGQRALNPDVFGELQKGMVSSHLKMVHKKVFQRVGLFDPRFDGTQDYDFFLRTAFYLPSAVGFVDKFLYFHRIHSNQNTKTENEKHKKNVAIIKKEAARRQVLYSGKHDELISFIILSFNRGQRLKRTIKAIIDYTGNFKTEIIIWDNNSVDEDTKAILKELNDLDNVRVFYSDTNLRCSGGRKAASKLANGEFLFFLDNDIEIQEGTLEELLLRFEEDFEIAGVCAKVLFPDQTIQYNGGHMHTSKDFVTFGLLDSGKQCDDLSTMKKHDCGWIPGGASLFRAEVLKTISHDSEYINAYEDNDFSYSISQVLHKKVANAPTATVVHYHANYETIKKGGLKEYSYVRHDKEAFIISWIRFYKKWGLIINDPFIYKLIGINTGDPVALRAFLTKDSCDKGVK